MLTKRACILLIAGFIIGKGNAADSDGKEFVFAFTYDSGLRMSEAAQATVIVIPSYNDATCSFTYLQNSDNKVVTVQETAKYGVTNEFYLYAKEATIQFDYLLYSFYNSVAKDFRIFVSCTEEVKLIGKISDPVYAWGDQFLIPSLKNAGTFYNFAMPTSDSSYKGTVGILPAHKEGSIMVNIVGYANGALLSNETIQYESTFGQNQHYIAINLYENIDNKFTEDINASISITTSSPVMLIFEAPETTSSNVYGDDSCGTECYSDFVQFMSVATQPLQCGSVLISADERMITNDFTTRLHVSSPNLGSYCDVPSLITVYDNTNNIEGTEQVVDKMGFTKIALDNISFAGFSTNAGEMATNRFGSIFGMDGVTAYGHFMTYIPSTKEWVSGKTQFYTLAKDCFLEFYTDTSNTDLIKIDSNTLSSIDFKKQSLSMLENKYSQFVVKIQGYGLHTIENDGNYVAYVNCKNVNSFFKNSAGYLTGYNQRKTN